MLALSVQAEDEIQGPTIKGVALEEEAVQLDVDFSNPLSGKKFSSSRSNLSQHVAHAAVDKPQLELWSI